jgi:hypothetical protein
VGEGFAFFHWVINYVIPEKICTLTPIIGVRAG